MRTDEVGGKRFTPNHGPRNFNNAANAWKEKPNFNWAQTQTFTSPQGGLISIHSSSYQIKEELRKKGIKSPSKLLSPKYLSPASIKELNKNPSSPKRVHFVNSIVILSTDSDTEEEDDSSTNACDLNLGGMVKGKEEVKEKDKEEYEMETDMEVEEVIVFAILSVFLVI
ncbi:hypothetical protein Tco_1214960 [Tanacetum coccineum]